MLSLLAWMLVFIWGVNLSISKPWLVQKVHICVYTNYYAYVWICLCEFFHLRCQFKHFEALTGAKGTYMCLYELLCICMDLFVFIYLCAFFQLRCQFRHFEALTGAKGTYMCLYELLCICMDLFVFIYLCAFFQLRCQFRHFEALTGAKGANYYM
jgi:hypothetical protein